MGGAGGLRCGGRAARMLTLANYDDERFVEKRNTQRRAHGRGAGSLEKADAVSLSIDNIKHQSAGSSKS